MDSPWTRTLVAALALFVSAPPSASAQDAGEELDRRLAHHEDELAADYAKLATWCHRKRLYLERDRLYEGVIAFDPDHAEARRFLHYRRGRDGAWVRRDGYRRPENRSTAHLAEAGERRSQALERYRLGVLEAIDGAREDLGPARVRAAVEKVLALAPDDPAIRARLGEVRSADGSTWILVESRGAPERRREIRMAARLAVANAPDVSVAGSDPREREVGLKLEPGATCGPVTALTTGDSLEATRAAIRAQACGPYLAQVLETKDSLPEGFRVLLLAGAGEKERILEHWPGLSEKKRRFLRGMAGCWLPPAYRLVQWSPDAERRLDGACRQSIGVLLRTTYGVTSDHAWIWEGMGLYLTYHLIGTRLTYFVQDSGYVPETGTSLRSRLLSSSADWLREARTLLESDRAPGLVFLLGKDVNRMSMEETLVSYALAAFLLEGRPTVAPVVLARVGQGEHPVLVLEEELGYEIAHLEERLVRWLREAHAG